MSSYLSMFIKEMDCQLKSKDEAKNNFYSKQVFYKYLDSLKKEAEALEIIKNKKVDTYTDVVDSWSYEEYVDNFNHLQKIDNGKYRQDCQLLFQEEYNLLKEVLS